MSSAGTDVAKPTWRELLTTDAMRKAALAAVVSGAVVLAAYLLARDALDTLCQEDGVVEYLTSFLYLAAALVFMAGAIRSPRARWWCVLFAIGFFFVAGEEVSWGQRLLGISTPESLRESNVQEELTLHNLDGVHGSVRMLGFLAFLGLYVAIPFAVARSEGLARLVRRLDFPVPARWIAPIVLVGLAFMVGPRVFGSVIFALDEVGELYLSFAALAYAWAVRGAAFAEGGVGVTPAARSG